MEYSNNHSQIIYSNDPEIDLLPLMAQYPEDKIFIATESNVHRLWFAGRPFFKDIPQIVLPSGEENKKIENVSTLWEFLSTKGADRKSLLINVGGGMLTDLCGFGASTFKRGIDFINIPTTLLSQVDASVGGKTGINFHGLKNEIGTFTEPKAVVISAKFLETLDNQNLRSGFAEMIKHGLIFSLNHLDELRATDLHNMNFSLFQEIIRHSVEVKEHFVIQDPREKNIRKALNFGHTVGHAIESLAMQQNHAVPHGYAVAWGMIAELFMSEKVCGLSASFVEDISQWIISLYGRLPFRIPEFDDLFRLMQHDKKNEAGRINFTLISSPGKFEINQQCSREIIYNSIACLQG
jgi:3-dehydroquinate synthase